MWSRVKQSIGMVEQILENTYLQELTSIRLRQEITEQHGRW